MKNAFTLKGVVMGGEKIPEAVLIEAARAAGFATIKIAAGPVFELCASELGGDEGKKGPEKSGKK